MLSRSSIKGTKTVSRDEMTKLTIIRSILGKLSDEQKDMSAESQKCLSLVVFL